MAYLSNFENYPAAVAALAERRKLWGNRPEALSRVRDPRRLAAALVSRGLPAPRLEPHTGVRYLRKPLASGGGNGVRFWQPEHRVPSGSYLQEYIEGESASIVFVADGRDAAVLGVSRQLAGLPALGTSGFRYCGSVLDPALAADHSFGAAAAVIATALTEEFGLVGLNGVDVIVRDGTPFTIEVNPRWSASMELIERAASSPLFALHATACADARIAELPFDYRRLAYASGKAIVYARHAVETGDTRGWLADSSVADVPRPGVAIAREQPVCTVFAQADGLDACVAALEARAACVHAEMLAWHGAPIS